MFRDFLDSMAPRPQPLTVRNVAAFLCIIITVFSFYFASVYVQPGRLTYIMSAVAVFLMGLTAWARLNDISPLQTAYRYQVRKLGLILTIAACTGLLFKPWVMSAADWPSWGEVMLRWGVTFVWMTTPMMPPWHRYISGDFRRQVVEVPANVEVNVVRTETVADGSMYSERRSPRNNVHAGDEGP